MIIVVIGGSCSGKTEFAQHCEHFGIPKVVTNTTRPKRVDDTAQSYHFLTRDEFMGKIERDEMVEYVSYNNNLYGLSVDSLQDTCVVVLEPKGYKKLKSMMPDRVYGILLDVSMAERKRRGIARGDSVEVIEARILEDSAMLTNDLRKSVNFVVCDLKREDIDDLIRENLTLFTQKNKKVV